jgi:hypothetical protein
MGETFEFWAHPASAEIYAIRQAGGGVTGVCGPIPLDAVTTLDLWGCQYGDPQRAAEWAAERKGKLVPAERWVLGFETRARLLGCLARAARLSAAARDQAGEARPDVAPAPAAGSNHCGQRRRSAAIAAGTSAQSGAIIEATITG